MIPLAEPLAGTNTARVSHLDDCRAALLHPGLTSDPHLAGVTAAPSRNLLVMAGRPHATLRRIIAPYLGAQAVEAMVPRLRAERDRLIARVLVSRSADLVTALIEPLVLTAIFEALSVHTEDRPVLAPLVRSTAGLFESRPASGRWQGPAAAVLRMALVFDRRRRHGPLVGLHRELQRAVDRGAVTGDQALFTVPVVLHGGFENPVNLLGLLACEGSVDAARSRAGRGSDVEARLDDEIARVAAVRRLVRWAREPVRRFGVTRGDALWVDIEAARLPFGWGQHRCPGVLLTKVLGQLVLEGLGRLPADVLSRATAVQTLGDVSRGVSVLTVAPVRDVRPSRA